MLDAVESARLKLVRAEEHIEKVRSIVWDYVEREPSQVTRHPDHKYELKFVESPPDAIAVIAGEVVYQIRSTLDHLAFELVRLNSLKIQLPRRWAERCQFPLLINIPLDKGTPLPIPLPYNHFEKTLPGITRKAFSFIESVQPYNRTDIGIYLGRLTVLSNIDKHRHLNVLKSQAHHRVKGEVVYKGASMIIDHLERVGDGAKIDSSLGLNSEEINVSRGFNPFVSFEEPELDPGVRALPVEILLQECLDQVQRTIIPAFETFVNQP